MDKYAKKRFEDLPNEPFEKVMDKILDELSLEMDAPTTFYIRFVETDALFPFDDLFNLTILFFVIKFIFYCVCVCGMRNV